MNEKDFLLLLSKQGGYRRLFFSTKLILILMTKIYLAVSDWFRVGFYRFQFLRAGKNIAISRNTSFGGIYNIVLEETVQINHGCNLYGDYGIFIGKNTKLSPYVQIYSANYVVKKGVIVGSLGTEGKPVLIGNNVWIGSGSVILPGVKIGDGSIIGALSLVKTNIPKNQFWAGNPARFIRKIK